MDQHVKINVYDINGRLVSELVNEKMVAGTHRIQFNGSNLVSGQYFIKWKKMVILKPEK